MHTFIIAEHPEFGKIRTVEKDGKIWFCARDIAASLGYANTRDAIDRHCKQKGVCVHDIPTTGGRQKVKFIDEGNVYRLIAGSRLPSAERFESWIFDDLVPRTLKEGGYLLDIKGETDSELLSRALLLAENRIKERDRHISVLEEKNAQNAIKLSRQAPKVRYFEEVLHSASTYTTTQIAKELGMSGKELNYRLKLLGVQFASQEHGCLPPDTTRKDIPGHIRMYGKTGTEKPERPCIPYGRNAAGLFIHQLLNFNIGY